MTLQKKREIIVLYNQQKITAQAAAEKLGISRRSVITRAYRMRKGMETFTGRTGRKRIPIDYDTLTKVRSDVGVRLNKITSAYNLTTGQHLSTGTIKRAIMKQTKKGNK